MSTTTTNYGLIKPDTTDPILIGQLNDNSDVIDTVLKDHSDKIDAAALGIKFKGEVNYYSNLPNDAEIGDAYTVKYAGSSGTTPDGTEYVWGAVSGVNQWINFSKDSYSKAEVDALLALKQNVLNSAQLAAVNSGIDSTKVAQIEMNKNNISLLLANIYNLFDLSAATVGTVSSSITYTITGGMIVLSTTVQSSTKTFEINDINLPVGEQLVIYGCPQGYAGKVQIDAFDNNNYISGSADNGSGSSPFSFTTMTNSKLRIRLAADLAVTNLTIKIAVCRTNVL